MIGAIAAGETPTSSEASDALETMNAMLDSWSIEGLMLYAREIEEFTLTAGQASRTMGTGGNFSTTRPIKIEQAAIRTTDTDPIDYPLKIATLEEWARIASKSSDSSIPHTIFVENTVTYVTIYFYPVPTVAYKFLVYSWKPLATIATLDTSVTLPPGYDRALVSNLAIELAPEYGKAVPAEIAKIASESKESIKITNSKPQIMAADPGVVGGRSFNIYTGE